MGEWGASRMLLALVIRAGRWGRSWMGEWGASRMLLALVIRAGRWGASRMLMALVLR